MNPTDKRILEQGKPIIIGVVALLIYLRIPTLGQAGAFHQARQLWAEFEKEMK